MSQFEILKKENKIRFICVNLDPKVSKDVENGTEKRITELNEELSSILLELESIKSLENEFKSFKSAPKSVEQVGEAVSAALGKKNEYKKFMQIIEKNKIINEMKNDFKIDKISDYTMSILKNYVNDATFTRDYVSQISKTAALFCEWVRIVYELKTLESVSNESESSSFEMSRDQLKDYLLKNSCFSFSWFLHLNKSLDHNDKEVKNVNSILNEIEFEKEKFIEMQQFLNKINTNKHLSDYGKTNLSLMEKHALSKHCRVKYIYIKTNK